MTMFSLVYSKTKRIRVMWYFWLKINVLNLKNDSLF